MLRMPFTIDMLDDDAFDWYTYQPYAHLYYILIKLNWCTWLIYFIMLWLTNILDIIDNDVFNWLVYTIDKFDWYTWLIHWLIS